MTLRLGTAVTVVGALAATATTAWAQTRDHREREEEVVKARRGAQARPPLEVTGWSPASGPVGTRVTIDGRGFSSQVQVLIGGRQAPVVRTTSAYLQVEIPSSYGDGTIVLRHPDMARDLVLGRFEVLTPPAIEAFSPTSGVPGTAIEIRGRGFEPGYRVLLGRDELSVSSIAPTRIAGQIPLTAATDYLVVVTRNGEQLRSDRRFEVTQPAPVITGMTPAGGPPGTLVRLSGQYFSRGDEVFYGSQRLALGRWAPGWIEVEVPADARRDDYFYVQGPYGRTRSPALFALARPPMIASFQPTYGAVGTRVELRGTGFEPTDVVVVGERRARILQLLPDRISIEIPSDAIAGVIAIERGGRLYPAAGSFEVLWPPRIDRFSPLGGPPGLQVTLVGDYFGPETTVSYAGRRLRIVELTRQRLVVELPRRAETARFVVATRGGTAETTQAYDVYRPCHATALRPVAGVAGSRVTIEGNDFGPTDRFWLGSIELPVEQRSPTQVVVAIPPGAVTGPLSWESHGVRQTSGLVFTVLEPPRFDGLSPSRAAPGARVEIIGDRFTISTRVTWGSRPLTIVERQLPVRLLVELPANAYGSASVYVEDAGMAIRGPQPLSIAMPIAIREVEPDRARPGKRVKIKGQGFEPGATVSWGERPCEVLRVDQRGQEIEIRLPDAAGSAYLWVDSGGQRVASPEQVAIEGPDRPHGPRKHRKYHPRR